MTRWGWFCMRGVLPKNVPRDIGTREGSGNAKMRQQSAHATSTSQKPPKAATNTMVWIAMSLKPHPSMHMVRKKGEEGEKIKNDHSKARAISISMTRFLPASVRTDSGRALTSSSSAHWVTSTLGRATSV